MPSDPSTSRPSLTILTVCMSNHVPLVQRNVQLIERLNPDAEWSMLVVDNQTTDPAKVMAPPHPRARVIPGVAADQGRGDTSRGSYHHAAALAKGLEQVKGRFLLVLDPDLYVLRPGWIDEVLAHMQEKKLAFFGVPWHPRSFGKYRDFPSVHFMLCDLEQVPKDHLDFTPELDENPPPPERAKQLPLPKRLWARACYAVGYPWSSRQHIGTQHDTGALIARSHRGRSHEVVVPVYDAATDFKKPFWLCYRWGRALERQFSEHRCFLPPPGKAVERAEAPEVFHSAAITGLNAEAFLWKEESFALHLRGIGRATGRSPEETLRLLDRALDVLMGEVS